MRQVAFHRRLQRDTARFATQIHVKEPCAAPEHYRAMHTREEHPMLDIVMLAIGLGFFALSIGYAFVCERL